MCDACSLTSINAIYKREKNYNVHCISRGFDVRTFRFILAALMQTFVVLHRVIRLENRLYLPRVFAEANPEKQEATRSLTFSARKTQLPSRFSTFFYALF